MLSTEYFLAGDAIFTAVGHERNYTFRIERASDHPVYGATWFASVLSGPENTSKYSYSYIGIVKEDGSFLPSIGDGPGIGPPPS